MGVNKIVTNVNSKETKLLKKLKKQRKIGNKTDRNVGRKNMEVFVVIKKGLKLAAMVCGAFLMWAGSTVDVHAAEAVAGKEVNYILEAQDWENRAANKLDKPVEIKEFATIDSKVIGMLEKGAYVKVIRSDEVWTRIESGNVVGYIRTSFLAFGEEAKELYGELHSIKGTITAASINIREFATSDSEIVTVKHKGDKIELMSVTTCGEWYKVRISNKTTGYMHGKYVEVEKDAVAMTIEEYEAKKAEEARRAEAERLAKEKKEQENKKNSYSAMSATKYEVAMLAAIIQCEAEGESYKGKVAVGAVVLNRVRSSKFPNSIGGVIKQKGQFTPVASGKFARVLNKGANSECYKAAVDALNGSNPIGQCLFFNTGSGRGFRLGNHQFY